LEKKSPIDIKLSLLAFMQPGETVQQTLRRLSGKTEVLKEDVVRRRKPQQQQGEDAKAVEKVSKADQQRLTAKQNREAIDSVIEIAAFLIARGIADIYSISYEALQAKTIRWEYQGADGSLYGPFTTKHIVQWRDQGYLTGETAVMIRKVNHRSQTQSESKKRSHESIYEDALEGEVESSAKKIRDNTGAVIVTQSNRMASIEDDNSWQHSDSVDFRALLCMEEEVNDRGDEYQNRNAVVQFNEEQEESESDDSDEQ
jgi:hypothetical protein